MSLFPCKSAKIYPANPDLCESIYLKWIEPNAYDACRQQYNKYVESLRQRGHYSNQK